jgi:hypothetical protein
MALLLHILDVFINNLLHTQLFRIFPQYARTVHTLGMYFVQLMRWASISGHLSVLLKIGLFVTFC